VYATARSLATSATASPPTSRNAWSAMLTLSERRR
jgi:hypothetical protein